MMNRDYKTPVGAAPPDWRRLCEELHLALERRAETLEEDRLLDRSAAALRAALTQPEPEVADGPAVPEGREPASVVGEPSDEELLSIAADCFAPVMVHFARTVLARYGRPAPVPAEGEVGEPVDWLRLNADECVKDGCPNSADHFTRAAELLERQAAPVPVAVSDRLPQPEDCDAEGRCWVHQPHEACPESPAWELMSAKYASANYGAVCWLPAQALPLPSGEVE